MSWNKNIAVRIFWDVLIISGVFILPWWVTLLLTAVGILIFIFYIEAVCISILFEVFYGIQGDFRFLNPVIVIFLIFMFVEFIIKPRVRSYER